MAEPFVVAQIALSLVLVITATLLVRTLLNLERAPFGFEQDHVVLAAINPRTAGYRKDDVGALYRRIYDRAVTLPGVERVTFARFGPFGGWTSTFRSTVEGYEPRAGETIQLHTVQVGPNYPQTLGMEIVQGRAITFADDLSAPAVAMVNEAFVARFFPSRSPLGRHFTNRTSYEIVGVVKDAQFHTAREPIPPTVFIPMLQEVSGMALDCELEVRTRGDAAPLVNVVRQAIGGVDARVTVFRTRTLREQVLSTFGPDRAAAGFIVLFAGVALLVASIGLYGTVSHGLAKRTNEIGVRLALGAGRADVLWLVGRETVIRLTAGLALGLALSWGTSRILASQLFGVTSHDAWSLAIAALLLAAVVSLATVQPMVRALRIDPAVALRAE
jgi:predicted permease